MKKIILLLLAALFVFSSALAQNSGCNFGVRTGVNFSNIGNSDYSSDYLTGFNVGGIYSMPIAQGFPLSVEGGLYFQMKGAKDNGFIAEVDHDTKFTSYQIEIPVVLTYDIPISGGWAIQPLVGLYYSLAVAGDIEFDGKNYDPYKKEKWATLDEARTVESQLLHRSDFGIRAGINIKLNQYLLGFSYDAGMLNIYSEEFRDRGFDAHSGCCSINLGYNF